MEVLELESPRLEEYLGILRGNHGLGLAVFRGQENSSWKLIPSLFRFPQKSHSPQLSRAELYYREEQQLIDAFFHRAVSMLPNIQRSPVIDRVICQHYGVPTQLLDWTRDPLIALFFAVRDWRTETDAAVYFLGPTYGSREGFWEVSLPNKGAIVIIAPPSLDSRVIAQKSVFSVQSYGNEADGFLALDDRDFSKSVQPPNLPHIPELHQFGKIRIPHQSKYSLWSDLRSFGIDDASLFPGPDGLGRSICTKYRV